MRIPINPGVARPPYGPLSRRRSATNNYARRFRYQSPTPLSRSLQTLIRRRAREIARDEYELRCCELFFALAFELQTQRISFEEIYSWSPGKSLPVNLTEAQSDARDVIAATVATGAPVHPEVIT